MKLRTLLSLFAPTLLVGTVAGAMALMQPPTAPSSLPAYQPIRYVHSLPSGGRFDGEIVVVVSQNGTTPIMYFWDARDQDFERFSQGSEENATFDGTVAITGATTLTGGVTGSVIATGPVGGTNGSYTGNVTLGSNGDDTVTVNGKQTWNVVREDFSAAPYYTVSNAWAASAVTDTSENALVLWRSQIGVIGYRWEQAFGGSVDFVNNGYLNLDLDDADNDGIDLVFGNIPGSGVGHYWDEDSSASMYCEISLLIADVSETDSVYFGWDLQGAYLDAGAWAGGNTNAYFVLSDAAGDLDIVTELNAGGSLNDDTTITWTDGQEKVLRVTIAADSVSFTVDGGAVTQSTAVLNADDTDRMQCEAGYLNATGDATPAPGIQINYVEIGVSQ